MDTTDIVLIERVASENVELRGLWREHLELDREIAKLEKVTFGPEQEAELRELKKRKLAGKDRIMQILATHRH